MSLTPKILHRLIEADDDAPHRREGVERVLRRRIVIIGRTSMALFLPVFARAEVPDRALRSALAVNQTLHAVVTGQLLRLFRSEARAAPPVPRAAAAAGVLGYVALVPFVRARRGLVTDVAGWYLFLVFLVDTVDGPLRRGRPAPEYIPMAAGLGAAAACRVMGR